MGGPEVAAVLSHLATQGRVADSTQNQALSALLFLYREGSQSEAPESFRTDHLRSKQAMGMDGWMRKKT